MAFVTGALGSVIPKLCELVKDEYNLQTGLKKKITRLSRDLKSMHAALRKVADVPPDQLDEEVKLWASDVRELSYDVDDILDCFLVRVNGREARDPNRLKRVAKEIRKLFSKSKACHQIGGMINTISEQANFVAQRHQRYSAKDIVAKPATKSTVDPRLAAMFKKMTELVGIEKPSAELISMMSLSQGDEASNKKMKIVSVVGTGGLGKTTLAKAVYDKVKVDFQCSAFVSVGRDPDLKKVFRDILIELDMNKYMDPKMTILNETQLINVLRKCLQSNRYFIVIDDIWEIKSWQMIQLALVQDNCGISRLITTTRNLEVARECGVVYKLEHLPFDASKKLFYTRVFGSEGKCHDTQLDEASDKMLKKCDGVPLAIITMASLLVGKSSQEWFEMCHSIIFRDKKNQQLSDTEWILSLSYYDLPAHLKTCLLYLSAFPEDHIIAKDSLIWKWVAEGFVHSEEPGTSLFEVGEGYFNELVNRSLIQTEEMEWDVHGCRLHDMVLDILCARSQEENFITISRNTNILEGTSSLCSRVRRLVLQNKTEEETHQDSLLGMDLPHVRTFISCGCDIFIANKVQRFELLRVLALEGCKAVNLEHVEKLLHLRYIEIRGQPTIWRIPEGIGALKFLQTLELKTLELLMPRGAKELKLPSTLGLLTQLTCLRASSHTVPSGVIGKLTCLEELKLKILYPDMFVKELGKLRELRLLDCNFFCVLSKSVQSDLVKCLRNLHKLKHLKLFGYSGNSLEKSIWDAVAFSRPLQRLSFWVLQFTRLPSCINPSDLPNLTVLNLHVEDLDEQGLKSLGTLPELRSLTLETQSTVTITVNDANNGFFHNLRFCRLRGSAILFVLNEDLSFSFTIWSDDVNDAVAFGSRKAIIQAPTIVPNLEVLDFNVRVRTLILNNGSCDKLGLEYLPSLRKVNVVFFCSGAFRDDVEKEEAALRHKIEVHPNRPTLQLYFFGKDDKKSRSVDDDDLASHDVVGGEVVSTSPADQEMGRVIYPSN